MSATHIGSTRSSVARSHLTELVPQMCIRDRGFGVLLGQVHGDLTRLSHFAGSFGRIEALDVDMQEVADDFDDVLDSPSHHPL